MQNITNGNQLFFFSHMMLFQNSCFDFTSYIIYYTWKTKMIFTFTIKVIIIVASSLSLLLVSPLTEYIIVLVKSSIRPTYKSILWKIMCRCFLPEVKWWFPLTNSSLIISGYSLMYFSTLNDCSPLKTGPSLGHYFLRYGI